MKTALALALLLGILTLLAAAHLTNGDLSYCAISVPHAPCADPDFWTWPNWLRVFVAYSMVLGMALPLLLTAAIVVTSPIWLTIMIVQHHRLRRPGGSLRAEG